jgi:phosphoserine phosphatase RsbU/P
MNSGPTPTWLARLDLRTLLRTGVKYALASNSVYLARLLLACALILLTIHYVHDAEHRWEAIVIATVGGLAIALLRRSADALKRWLDRKFFREEYNAELILSELANSVASIRDRKALMETVTRRIEASMHPVSLALFLEHNAAFTVAHSFGTGLREPATLQAESAVLRMLRLQNAPAKVNFSDPQSWVNGASELEQSLLLALHTELLIPITVDTRLVGILSLGRKRSDSSYSRRDLQLLSAVASQTGLSIENARLTENIRKEVAQRERLNRELEIAREVQQRLFPQTLPQVQGLDFAGYCRPALGVGGDYYDFIRVDDGCLGIAIG